MFFEIGSAEQNSSLEGRIETRIFGEHLRPFPQEFLQGSMERNNRDLSLPKQEFLYLFFFGGIAVDFLLKTCVRVCRSFPYPVAVCLCM